LDNQGGIETVKRIIAGVGLWLFLPGGGFGQAPTAKPEFEVADIRQNKSNDTAIYERVLPDGEISARNIPMKEFLKFAYFAHDVRDEQIAGGPAWLNSDRFDTVGKATPGTPDETIRLMLQNLLEKEFKLAVHQEQRPMDVYALVVGKGGPKLQKAAGSGKVDCRRRVGGGQDPAAKDMPAGQAELVCTNMTMADLAEALPVYAPGYVDHAVVDLTNIKGAYDLKLSWVSRLLIDQGGLTMFDAVDKQLGLKMEPRKLPMPFLVIDHVEKLAGDN
jgi:uncharacterized protein (TIGR03435 family)